MEVQIANKTDNKLLHRVEVTGKLSFDGATPSHKELEDALSKNLKKDKNVIVVKNIYTGYGSRSAKFEAFVYENPEKLVNVERKEKPVDAPAKNEESEGAEKEEVKGSD